MEYARDKARKYVNGYTAGGSAFSVLPIPGSTAIGLSLAEATMVGQVASIYGLKLDSKIWPLLLKVILFKVGGAAGLKALAEGLNVIPVIGWIAKPFVAGSAVKAIGEGAILFFEARFPNQRVGQTPHWDALKSAFSTTNIDEDELRIYWEGLSSL